MNEAGVPFTRKDEVSLATWPVGPRDRGPGLLCRMVTVGDTSLTPAAVTEYCVLTLVIWSETEKEPSASLRDSPRVLEVGVGELGEAGDVGNQVRLDVPGGWHRRPGCPSWSRRRG